MHGFCDASIKAYGAAIYVRIVNKDGYIQTNLLVSKSRVAPIKKVTIPRLELAAAELLSKLYVVVSNAMEWKTIPYYLWSDSTIALQWINKESIELKMFVANRVKQIRDNTEVKNWNHVRTHDNPADLVSRGISACEIVDNDLWWHGPSWLAQVQKDWPKSLDWKSAKFHTDIDLELKVFSTVIRDNSLHITSASNKDRVKLVDYSNNLRKIVRIVAYVFQFTRKCREKKKSVRANVTIRASGGIKIDFPTREEQGQALAYLLRYEQRIAFSREYKHLKEHSSKSNEKIDLPEGSKVLSLRPFLDANELIRVGGRISHAECAFDMKHPVIVPTNSRMSELLIFDAHVHTLHGAVQVMMRYIRNRYWVSRLRNQLRLFVHKCVTCARYNKTFENQLMADLPPARVHQNRPFAASGVNYAGPFSIAERYGRKVIKRKGWIAIFVCMITRAVHIDMVVEILLGLPNLLSSIVRHKQTKYIETGEIEMS